MPSADLIEKANKLTIEAGNRLLSYFEDPEYRKSVAKEDGSPVTKADLEVSEFLVRELGLLGYPVVSEEGPIEVEGANYFIIDPLDGTKYFVKGDGLYVTCVGLVIGGQPVYGAIYEPQKKTFYHGVRGRGAWKNGEPITHNGHKKGLVAFSRGFHKKPRGKEFMKALNIVEIKKKEGALKFCAVAEGEADLYPCFGASGEWDTAAAHVILNECSCEIYVAQTGEVLTYGKSGRINPGVMVCHRDLKDKIFAELKKGL